MPISYSLYWNDLLKEPLDPISEDEARRRHQAGEPYVAYVHDVPGRQDTVVEVALFSSTVVVYFLDERRQRARFYGFSSDGHGGLFLDEMGWRSYQRDGQIGLAESHRFVPDEGVIEITRYSRTTETEYSAKQKLLDTTPLMEPIPAFGDYESITRYER